MQTPTGFRRFNNRFFIHSSLSLIGLLAGVIACSLLVNNLAYAQSASDQCDAASARAGVRLDVGRFASSSRWLQLEGIASGNYRAQLVSDVNLNGHTLNFASSWSPNDVYTSIDLNGRSQQLVLNTNAERNIAFVTHPSGSSGATITLYVCDATPPDDGNPGDGGGGDGGDPGDGGSDPVAASGLPKRSDAGSLVTAQSSGLPLSIAFNTSDDDYWFNHPGVNNTLSDTCVRLHDSYWTAGPDGKAYPTWHPAVASEGSEQCFFGHEHGDDPSSSPFYTQRTYRGLRNRGFIPVPFGYANEVLAENGGHRHEDHFGHKIFRERFRMAYGNSVSTDSVTSTGAVCDALLKLHQGTHSADGLSNHLHEAIAHVKCNALPGYPASRAHVTALVPIGRPGWFSNNCSGPYPVPGQTNGTRNTGENNAPAGSMPTGNLPIVLGSPLQMVDFNNATQYDIDFRIDGERIIPAAGCLNTWQGPASTKINNRRFGQAMNDTWVRPLTITDSLGQNARFYLKSYYSVHNSSRVFFVNDNGQVTTQSSVDACRNPPPGSSVPNRPSDLCQQVLDNPSITVYDTESPYNGTVRNLNFKTLDLSNDTGRTTLWTDAFGRETNSTDPVNAIRQFVSKGYNGASALNVAGTIATRSSNRVCRRGSGPYPTLAQSDECYWDGNDDLLFAKEWWRDFSSPSLRIHSPN